jgi:hypothetical protein
MVQIDWLSVSRNRRGSCHNQVVAALLQRVETAMLYRFKSKASGDVVMLGPNGKQLLEILGKDPEGPGILLPEDMPAACEAIAHAVAQDEAMRAKLKNEAQESAEEDAPSEEAERISLRTRVAPFLELVQHSMREKTEVVWGV